MAEEHSFGTTLANLFITVLYYQTRKPYFCAGKLYFKLNLIKHKTPS